MTQAGCTAASLAAELEQQVRSAGNPERAVREKAYLKSELTFVGTSVPDARAIAKTFHREQPELAHTTLDALVAELWARGIHECRVVTVEVLAQYQTMLGAGDLALVERLLRDSHTWALVDGLAITVVAPVVEQHPAATARLDRWAKDPDFWVRRSALLALLPALRRGDGDFERFGRYADRMLDEQEFFIRKAIGWVLRDTARRRPDLVADWLLPRAHRASGVTVREAVKHLPEQKRQAILREFRG